MKRFKSLPALSAQLIISIALLSACSEPSSKPSVDVCSSWTHFRGSGLNAISSCMDVPEQWNDSLNIEWRSPLPGKGWSSPVILDEQIWLTAATDQGREMRAICLDSRDGQIIHNKLLFAPDTLFRIHAVNSYATPSPAIEKGRVYISFGRYGTACLDSRTGEAIWKRSDVQVEHIQGPGSSLFIYKDKLIVHLEGSDRQIIQALDKENGETLWQIERPGELYDKLEYIGKKAYTTPIIVSAGGRELLISNGSAACMAYDPETGEEIWRIVYGEDSTVAMPSESDGILFFYTAFETDSLTDDKKAQLLAVDPDGKGDITESHIIWSRPSPILQLLSPVIVDGLLYTIDSRGLMLCLDAHTGVVAWEKKMKGKFHSSPIYADGKVYFSSTRGETYVVKAGKEYQELALNRIEGEIWATPAIAGGSIFLRSSKYLYKISR